MRGEHLGCPLWAVHLSRITPACAGSTWEVVYQNEDYGDHPRMRGEHLIAKGTVDEKIGSPPHARGAPYGYCKC